MSIKNTLASFLSNDKQRFHISRMLTAVLVLTGMFSFGQFNTSPTVLSAGAESTNPVVTWNTFTGRLGVLHQHGPPDLARDYVLVHVAIYDALLKANSIKGNPSQAAVVAGAASEVLQYLFPDNAAQIIGVESSEIASIHDKKGKIQNGLDIGHKIGKKVVKYAKTDGYNTPWDGNIPPGSCNWTGVSPIGATFGSVKTFVLNSWDEFPIPPPPECGSPEDLAEIQLVIDTHDALTDEQRDIARRWEPIPALIHNDQLNERILSHNLSIFDAARAAVYVNIASHDSMVAVWHSKYIFWTGRPFQLIDGFDTVIATPNFPAYPSGHSTAAPATAIILGHLFPEDAEQLILDAQENALSRLLGGVHWNVDDTVGYNLGLQIGNKVLEDMLGSPHPFVSPHDDHHGEHDEHDNEHGDKNKHDDHH